MLRYESPTDPQIFEEQVTSSEDGDFDGLRDEEDAIADLFTEWFPPEPPTGPKKVRNIDIYLEPLVEELQQLWTGVDDVYDGRTERIGRDRWFTLKDGLVHYPDFVLDILTTRNVYEFSVGL
ncbi:hypothetical protein R1sor_012701 [Riccia sorocarpa]|uniref:Uncharacterized protein n=1 Tax=Riccia sorocarpa TaxID=122646 RepID=A0ABD3I4I9_9MARC